MNTRHELALCATRDARIEPRGRDVDERHARMTIDPPDERDLAPAQRTVAIEEDLDLGSRKSVHDHSGIMTVSMT